jgi:hypothetical protein
MQFERGQANQPDSTFPQSPGIILETTGFNLTTAAKSQDLIRASPKLLALRIHQGIRHDPVAECLVPISNTGIKLLIYYNSIKQREQN